ncbi:MAG TPA: preprotein translocase subunit YajC [Gaiellaceae bacterium]|jgi:preprotein translocase subunit YajC
MSAGLILIVVAFVFLWLVLIRPQRKRQLQQTQLWQRVAVGDEVLTAGGVYGEVTAVHEEDLMLEIAPELEVRVARRAIAAIVEPAEAEDEDELQDEPDDEPDEDEKPPQTERASEEEQRYPSEHT